MEKELDYAGIFEKMVEDSGRHNINPAKLSSISREILILMIDCKSMTPGLAVEIGKTTRETSARLFRLKKSGYVKKTKTGWELTVLGEVLAKHLRSMKSKELVLR
ncbi:hypothetical protein KKF81_02410 [Candidatus Micrarchaeota archaeon]|nr:hypothetical protein [Candidatus Micrarchaeota archaeon]MBU1886634.1 hypothetical protein [Candidatus Micrarchaeota archaeon]